MWIPVAAVGAPVHGIPEEGSAGCGGGGGGRAADPRGLSPGGSGGAARQGVRVQMSGLEFGSPVCLLRNLLKTGRLLVCPK